MADSYQIISFKGKELPQAYTGLVYARWLRSFRRGNDFLLKSDPAQYFKHYHAYIERLLNHEDSEVRLAVLSDDHDVVLGFAVTRWPILDYVHVQINHRRHGVAKKLVPPGIITITHLTKLATGIWDKKYKDQMRFNPYA